MWTLVIVVLDEVLVELESRMFEVVGSEPSFDLSERRGLADAAEDMPDAFLRNMRRTRTRLRGRCRIGFRGL